MARLTSREYDSENQLTGTNDNLSDPPDLTVIGPDGKQLAARYVGLDGVTGYLYSNYQTRIQVRLAS